jgi:hypothetical protein
MAQIPVLEVQSMALRDTALETRIYQLDSSGRSRFYEIQANTIRYAEEIHRLQLLASLMAW